MKAGFGAAAFGVFEKTKALTKIFAERRARCFRHDGNMRIFFVLKTDKDLCPYFSE